MVKRGYTGNLNGRERVLGGMLLVLYLAVLPLIADPVFDFAGRLLGVKLGEGLRDAIYYYVLFALTLAVFWSFLGQTTRRFFDRPWHALASVGMGLVAFYGINELCWRLLHLAGLAQANLNDAAISAKLATAPHGTILIVVFLAPFIEEALFRGYVFGYLREYSRAGAYLASCVLFALVHVWQFAAAGRSPVYLLLALQYLAPGLVLAWTYERSGSLWGSILLHGVVNALAVWSVL